MSDPALTELWDWVRAVEFEFVEKRPKVLGLFGERGPSSVKWRRFQAAQEVREILERNA